MVDDGDAVRQADGAGEPLDGRPLCRTRARMGSCSDGGTVYCELNDNCDAVDGAVGGDGRPR